MTPQSYEQLQRRADRYAPNDPRHDDSLAVAEDAKFHRCMTDRECVQESLTAVFAEFDGYEIADAIIAGDHSEAGRLLAVSVRKEMRTIAANKLRGEIDDNYTDAF